MRAFVKMRGSLHPDDQTVFYFTGTVYASLDDTSPTQPLFSLDGYNIARTLAIDGGYRLLTREVAVYRDLSSGRIVDAWSNPFTGLEDKVVQVWNDPVNQDLLADGNVSLLDALQLGDDVCISLDVFPRYQSPLPRSRFPDVGGRTIYNSAELFHFTARNAQLADGQLRSAPCSLAWTRIGPWLPWMRMGERDGKLIYHCKGAKLAGGFDALPQDLRQLVLENDDKFAQAPHEYYKPNETSWSYMRKLIERKGLPRADGRVAVRVQGVGAEGPVETGQTRAEKKGAEQAGAVRMTREELALFDGRDGGKIYVSVGGKIFDVSSSRENYAVGETYHSLAGRDASMALVRGELRRGTVSVGKLGEARVGELRAEERETLEGWAGFFAKKYLQVGELVDL